MPWQHTLPMAHGERTHMFSTHMPMPWMTAHSWPGGHSLFRHGSGMHIPSEHTSPILQLAHGVMHMPMLLQNWPALQVTPKQGSGVHIGGVPVHRWPIGQPFTRHDSSTHAPSLQTNGSWQVIFEQRS